jgi:glycosyltransferase involved in cell wall biosynthesis
MKIHYHSDCRFFAGCENMLTLFFNDQKFASQNEFTFSFNYSIEYEVELKSRVKFVPKTYSFCFPDLSDINTLPSYLSTRTRRYILFLTRLIFGPVYTIVQILKIYNMLRNERPEVLHINNGGYPGARSCLAAAFAGKLVGIPCIVMVVNNIALDYSSPSRKLGYLTDRWVVRCVDVFVCGSEFASIALKSVLGLDEKKCTNIYNGIEPRPVEKKPTQVLEGLGLNNFDGQIFGCVALFEKRKGHITLLKAIEALKSKQVLDNYPCLFLLEGEGPELDAIANYICAHDLSEYVVLVGHYQKIMDLMNAFDALILPSLRGEDLPNVISEAMSFPKIVIASDVAGTTEQVVNDETGFIFEAGNFGELADIIERVLSTKKEDLSEMLSSAHSRFYTHFSSAQAVRKYEYLYQNYSTKDVLNG